MHFSMGSAERKSVTKKEETSINNRTASYYIRSAEIG